MVATLRRIALLIPSLAAAPVAVAQEKSASVSEVEYEGWRQYSVHCARCHGQDALPNPVAANLLTSVAPGGPTAEQKTFTKVVVEGRTSGGMPAFKGSLEPAQVAAIYDYVKGRAEQRIPPGRPKQSGS